MGTGPRGLHYRESISRWDQVDFAHAVLHVRRAKKGVPSIHPIRGDEMRALRKLQREQDPKSPFVFTSPSGARRSLRQALRAWWSALVSRPS